MTAAKFITGLGSSATKDVGSVAGKIAAGDDYRFCLTPYTFGAAGDGFTDDGVALQAWLDAVAAAPRGLRGALLAGTYATSRTLIWPARCYADGIGFGKSVIKLLPGSNVDLVKSAGYDAGEQIYDFGFRGITFDGGYFTSDRYASPGVLGNTAGYGLKIRGYLFDIDIEVNNVAEVGAVFAALTAPRITTRDVPSRLAYSGRVYGKEGLILRGPGDGIVRECFVGLAGILPRPAAETQIAMSTEFPGEPAHGIVVDGCNAEWGKIHAYACWSGAGLWTRGSSRFQADHLILESNRIQGRIEGNTYGGASLLSMRNIASCHINWTGPLPAYDLANPAPAFGGLYVSAPRFGATIRGERVSNNAKRIVGSPMVWLAGSTANISLDYWAATGIAGEPEVGLEQSGPALLVTGVGNVATVATEGGRGTVVLDRGSSNVINGVVRAPQGTGIRAEGSQGLYGVTVREQIQDGGTGAAYSDGGQGNTWSGTSASNAVPFDSDALPTNRTQANVSNTTTRVFVVTGNAITVTAFDSDVVIDAAVGLSSETLSNIYGMRVGQRITLRPSSAAVSFLIADDTGNLRLAENRVLDHFQDRLVLEWTGSQAVEVSYANNTGATAAATATYTVDATGSITINRQDRVIRLDTDATASRTLTTILGGATNQIIDLYTSAVGRTVILSDSGGNIRTAGGPETGYNRVLDHFQDRVRLVFDATNWVEMSFADVSGTSTAIPLYTLASGAIGIGMADKVIRVDTEAAAATGTLTTMTGGYVGQIVTMYTVSASRQITVAETGNFRVSGTSRLLSHFQDGLTVRWDGSAWDEVSYADVS